MASKTHRDIFNNANAKIVAHGAWAYGHHQALAEAQEDAAAGLPPSNQEAAYALLLLAWLDYADAHARENGSPIGQDGFLGPVWAAMGFSLLKLLNASLGRLDAATLNKAIATSLAREGFDRE
jgi:hypothetical protein